MKKLFRIFLLTLICFLVSDNIAEFNAVAAENAQMSGVEISISSDKSEYSVGEDTNIKFSIKNNNESDLNNLNWKLNVPDDLKLKDGDLSGQNIKISAGDTLEGSVVVAKVTTLTQTSSTATTTTTKNNVKTDSAKTGDYTNIMLPMTIIILSVLLAFLSRKKSKKIFKLFSLLLCVAFVSTLKPAMAFCEKNDEISVNVDRTIKIDNSQYKIELSVNCDCELTVSNELYAWAEYNQKDNIISLNWLEQSDSVAYRVYNKQSAETPIAEVKGLTKYDFSISESDKYVFYIESENANGKKKVSNDVVVNRNENGSYSYIDMDSDNDGLSDLEEIKLNTKRFVSDTDNDGLLDGYEYTTSKTDPLLLDTDEDGISDGSEDYEGDGLTNIQEYKYKSNPYAGDTDKDGFPDGYEVENGMDPLTFDEIIIDNSIASQIKDYTEYDLEILNANEEYPLEVYYNDEGNIERINGVYTSDKIRSAQDALYSLYNIKSLLGIEDPSTELKYIKTVFNQWSTSYSFVMIYDGIEAEGRNITVSCLKDGKVSSIFSGYLSHDVFEGFNTKPDITKNEIADLLNKGNDNKTEVVSSELCIRIDTKPVLAYRVITEACETVWIDAHTCEEIYRASNIDYLGPNSEYFEQYGEDNDMHTIPVYVEYGRKYLYDEERNIYICDPRNNNVRSKKKPEIIDTVYYEFENDKSIEKVHVSSYLTLKDVYDSYKRKGYVGMNGEGGDSCIIVHANMILSDDKGPVYGNGGYDKNYSLGQYEKILICDPEANYKDDKITFASNKQVIGHEFGHAIFKHKAAGCDLTGSFINTVNEAYADIFGSYANGGWWTKLRNIPDPHKTGNPIIVNDQFIVNDKDKKTGEIKTRKAYDPSFKNPHTNSTIISHVAYLLIEKYKFSMDEVFDLFYNSLDSFSGTYNDFWQVEVAVIDSGRQLGYTNLKLRYIVDAFRTVGVELPIGNAIITVQEGDVPFADAKIILSNYGSGKEVITDDSGRAVFNDMKVGTYSAKIIITGREPIYARILIKKNEISEKVINLLTANTGYDWDVYDHYNFVQYWGPTLSNHIDINGSDITMTGYTEAPFKDFLLTHENDTNKSFVHSRRKILSFKLEKDDATDIEESYWHSLEGGGFLFDVSITDQDEENEGMLTAHCVLVTPSGLELLYLENVDIRDFRNGNLGTIVSSETRCCKEPYDIGDVKAKHSISIDIEKDTIEKISIWDNDKLIVDNLEINKLDGDDYGPITSHFQHKCQQVSWFTFSDIQMNNIS